MRPLYSLLFTLLLPLILLRLLWRSRKQPAYRERMRERLGFYGSKPLKAAVWIHAVSLGEVQAAVPLIEHCLQRFPEPGVLATTTTPTGAAHLRKHFGPRVRHLYTPLDLPWILERFLRRVQPRLVILLETEIWPNLLAACHRRALPIVLANARLSKKSARRYGWLGSFTRETLQRFTLIAAQTKADARRFRVLGAPAQRIQIMGNLKFDLSLPADLRKRAQALRRIWGDRPVWIAASTHAGEEEIVLESHRQVRQCLPNALLVLVPRHPERFDAVADLAERWGFPPARRSRGESPSLTEGVFLGDTLGELPLLLGASDVAFFGGSLVPIGGHNLLEAAALGIPVLMGPHMHHFAEITALLVRAGGARQIPDGKVLAQTLCCWLPDANLRARMGKRGKQVLEQNRGALLRLIEQTNKILHSAVL